MYDVVEPEAPSDWLTFSAKLILVMEGLLNFFAYGFNTALSRIVYRCFRRDSCTNESFLNNILTTSAASSFTN